MIKSFIERVMQNTILRSILIFILGLTLIMLSFFVAYIGIHEIAGGNTTIRYSILTFFILIFLIIMTLIHYIWKKYVGIGFKRPVSSLFRKK